MTSSWWSRKDSCDARRAAVVAAEVVADATIRAYYSGAGDGPGLRGGSFRVKGGRYTFTADRFVADAPVRGTARWNAGTGGVHATITVRTPEGRSVKVTLSWTQRSRFATATVGSATLRLPAP